MRRYRMRTIIHHFHGTCLSRSWPPNWLQKRLMKLLIAAILLFVMAGIATTVAAVTLELGYEASNEINVTTDSSSGWIPTVEQRRQAIKTIQIFLTAVEDGRYAEAYGMQTDSNRCYQTLDQFSQDAEKFQIVSGPSRSWTVLKVTWSKNPTRAAFRGIYVAIDLSARFAKVDRQCGYIILYQRPDGGDFAIMRRENIYLDNATARKIEKEHSKADVAKIWTQLSRYCPNYAFSPSAR
jgi:hypothetical protein